MLQDPNVEKYVSEKLKPLEDQIKIIQAEMFKLMQANNLNLQNVNVSALLEMLKSESVSTLLRFGVKSPSRSGMDDCEDHEYYNLYTFVQELRSHSR